MRRLLSVLPVTAAALVLMYGCTSAAPATVRTVSLPSERPVRLIEATEALSASPAPPPAYPPYNGHPRDANGFVTDGSPQADDAHCVGTDLQRSECYEARRPQCSGHGRKAWGDVLACFAPEVNLYPWPKGWALNVIDCESGGDQWATNHQYVGLMQEGAGWGSTDPARNIWTGFHHFYAGGGPGQWSTSGMQCH